jgi:hypothetical protein
VTQNAEVNILAGRHFSKFFGANSVYLIRNQIEGDADPHGMEHIVGQYLFDPYYAYKIISKAILDGRMQNILLTETFDYKSFVEANGDTVKILFVIRKSGGLHIVDKRELNCSTGDRLIYITTTST